MQRKPVYSLQLTVNKKLASIFLLAICHLLLAFVVLGCAEITPPNPVDLITHPWGQKPPVRIGTTKDEVRASWGEPDDVVRHGAAKLGAPREEWVYYGQVPQMPVDYKYLSKTKHLFFEGEVLTRWTSD